MSVVLRTTVKLRRDSLLNYSKVGSHIPEKGEVCIVDTLLGTRVKVGDGNTSFSSLEFSDSKIVEGYYNNGKFYKETLYTTELPGYDNILYIDLISHIIYY